MNQIYQNACYIRKFSWKIFASLLLYLLLFTQFIYSQEKTQKITFRNFSGVCQGNVQRNLFWQKSLGWSRHDFSWSRIQPEITIQNEKGFKKYDEKIIQAKKKNIKILPVLAYGPSWKNEKKQQEFIFAGQKYIYKKLDNKKYQREIFDPIISDNKTGWKLISTRIIPEKKIRNRWLSNSNIENYKKHIHALVSRYRKPPYNLEYFQVWNEAHPQSGFWHGDMDTYIKKIHIPAAKIIQELGGKVVYGGWICGESIQEMCLLLDRHKAWDSIDVFDLHYFPLADMDFLRKQLLKRKIDRPIWQTEIGFSSNPNTLANLYPRTLYWGLENNWDTPDKYKLFWFAYLSPNDPKAYGYKRCLGIGTANPQTTLSGKTLQVMSEVFGNESLSIYKNVNSIPKLNFEVNEQLSSLEAFRTDNKIIVTCHMIKNNNARIFIDWNGNGDSIHLDFKNPKLTLNFPELKPEMVKSIDRVAMLGNTIDISENMAYNKNNGLSIQVPIREKIKDIPYTDMPQDFLPELFYTVINLK